MPRYYCDYCDTYLTHDSPSVRKQHNAGYKHKANVRTYYQQFEEQQTQSLIDQKIKEHLSGQGAYQMGAVYGAAMWRPGMRPPILPPPLPIPGAVPPNAAMMPGIRLPVLPRPPVMPVYGTIPVTTPPGSGQPGVPGAPAPQANGLPGPPALSAPAPSVPGAMAIAPATNGAPPNAPQPGVQGAAPTGGPFGGPSMPSISSFPSNASYPTTSASDGSSYAQTSNASG